MSQKSDLDKIHRDAQPQFAPGKRTSDNNGVASAKPTVITKSDDATANKLPPGTKKPEKDWNINYDERDTNEGDFRG